MKKTAFIILVLVNSVNCALAQKPRVQNTPTYDSKLLHFGFTIGLNTMDYDVDVNKEVFLNDTLYPDIRNLSPGFHVSMVSDLRLGRYFNLRFLPGISFGQRNVTYKTVSGILDREFKVPSTYLEFPLLVKYKAERINNYRPYLISGANIRYDMASNKEFNEEEDFYIRFVPLDFFYELGIGIDYYLPYFKFATELKISVGLRDIINHEPHPEYPIYVESINKAKSFIIGLSFHFE